MTVEREELCGEVGGAQGVGAVRLGEYEQCTGCTKMSEGNSFCTMSIY